MIDISISSQYASPQQHIKTGTISLQRGQLPRWQRTHAARRRVEATPTVSRRMALPHASVGQDTPRGIHSPDADQSAPPAPTVRKLRPVEHSRSALTHARGCAVPMPSVKRSITSRSAGATVDTPVILIVSVPRKFVSTVYACYFNDFFDVIVRFA